MLIFWPINSTIWLLMLLAPLDLQCYYLQLTWQVNTLQGVCVCARCQNNSSTHGWNITCEGIPRQLHFGAEQSMIMVNKKIVWNNKGTIRILFYTNMISWRSPVKSKKWHHVFLKTGIFASIDDHIAEMMSALHHYKVRKWIHMV